MLEDLSTYLEDLDIFFNKINIQHKNFKLTTLKGKSILKKLNFNLY